IGRTYLVGDIHKFEAPMTLKEFAPQMRGPKTDALLKAQDLFEREARILNDLHHPQIPKFHGYFEENGRLFLVQDYIKGKNYRELLRENGLLSEAEALDFLQSVLGVLDYIHRHRKTIHRDISPENIMRQEESGTIYLIDFGIGKQLESSLVSSTGSAQQLSIVGKPSYCPPEQMRTGVCSESSDLYALAMTTIELLTGYPPQDDRSWPQSLPQPISPHFAAILTKMLAFNIEDRYSSTHDVLEALAKAPGEAQGLATLVEPNSGQNSEPALTTLISVQAQSGSNTVQPGQGSPVRRSWKLLLPILLGVGLLGLWGLQQLRVEDLEEGAPTDPVPDIASPDPSVTATPILPSPTPSPSPTDSSGDGQPLPTPPSTTPTAAPTPIFTPTPLPSSLRTLPPRTSPPLPPQTPVPTT
ncbi:MAG: protein kinase domain-containing protein, partial [Prochlorothrix sp.]